MYRQFGNTNHRTGFAELAHNSVAIAQSGRLDALVALERIGARVSFPRNTEIYAEGGEAECWYKVVSGTARICKLLADGRRHIAEFCFSGDCFGLDGGRERPCSAEAVDDVIVMRFPRNATERLVDQNPAVARVLREAMLCDLATAHGRGLLLGRMTAPERVATFLCELVERREKTKALDLPMSRSDIADYLGLTVETVCRTLSAFKREGVIAIPNPHRIELLDRDALVAMTEC
ncbi:MAG TPA: helix-turn-helix domain-containing protein [Stellaceae bacterium]|nr:helix-turn-helix domain-containing protein [Stellaceae bacterium]